MGAVFTDTTTLLSAEFVETFAAEELAMTLFKVGQETGVEFNRQHHTFIIAGHWEAIVKAHTALEYILDNELLKRGRMQYHLDLCNAPAIKEKQTPKVLTKEKTTYTGFIKESIKKNTFMVNDPSRRGRKPGCTLQLNENPNVPEPFIHYPYDYEPQERSLMSQEMLKPTNLLEAIDRKSMKSLVLGQKSNVTKHPIDENSKTFHLDETSGELSDIKNKHTALGEISESKTKEIEIKTEILEAEDGTISVTGEDGTDMSDDDTDIDEQYLTKEEVYPETDSEHKDSFVEVKVELEKTENELPLVEENASDLVKSEAISDTNEEPGDEPNIMVKLEKNAEKVKAEKTKRKHRRKNTDDADENTEHHCKMCSYIGKKSDHLKEHIKRKHTNRFTCDVCQKQFGFNKDLNRHKKNVHGEPAHFCDICNKLYKTKRAYETHIETHQEDYVKPNFDCKICEKTFCSKYVLAGHIKTEHLGMKKTFMCPRCGKTFTHKSSYLTHANVHVGIKPYVCDVCGKAFSYEKSLKEHVFMHDNIRRFKCHICSKTFRQTSSLRTHMKVHKETKDYVCKSCGKGFTQKQALLRHERIHSGDKPYTCNICSRTFSDYSIVRRHMMLIHKTTTKDWKNDMISNKEHFV